MKLARSLVAAAAVLLALATSSAAVTIDSVGDAFDVAFDGSIETETVAGLSAAATFTVTALDGAAGVVTFEIVLRNTTDASLWQRARVSAIGFDVSSELLRAAASGLFSSALRGGRFPNRFGPVDVCAIDNRNNCSGGGSGGLRLGESGSLTMTLGFIGPIEQLDLTNFGIRWQSLTSHELRVCDASGTGHGTVPEPAPLALLGAATAALAATRLSPRRR